MKTITSTTGSKVHEMHELVEIRPGQRSGVVEISSEIYLVTSADGSMDELEFAKAGGPTYRVSCWGPEKGNSSCECPDWKWRRTTEQRHCKHIACALALKTSQVRHETTVDDLLTVTWEL